VKKINDHIIQINKQKKCVFRETMAKIFGDSYFNFVRNISSKFRNILNRIDYVHG